MPKQFIITILDDGKLQYSHPGIVCETHTKLTRKWSPTGSVLLPVLIIKVHHLVMKVCKPNPNKYIFTDIDHEDGDTENPSPNNLGWATRQMNSLNRKHAKGWFKKGNRYESRLCVGRIWTLGYFNTPEEAKARTDYYRLLTRRYIARHWENNTSRPESTLLTIDPLNIDPDTLQLTDGPVKNPHSHASLPRRRKACSQRRTNRRYTPRTKVGSSQ